MTTYPSSEQSGSILVLIALAFFVGSNVELTIPEPEPYCVKVQDLKYEGRDQDGRASWSYPEKEQCYDSTGKPV